MLLVIPSLLVPSPERCVSHLQAWGGGVGHLGHLKLH